MTSRQKIEAPTADDQSRIERQRSWVREHYDAEAQSRFETMEGKLVLLETILRSAWIAADETWKLQSLGIVFGDALAQRFNLEWVMVEDEYGRDPALKDPLSTILLFPMTSLSKRIEHSEALDVRQLFDEACRTVTRVRAQVRTDRPH